MDVPFLMHTNLIRIFVIVYTASRMLRVEAVDESQHFKFDIFLGYSYLVVECQIAA
jgi:hypothetical protein